MKPYLIDLGTHKESSYTESVKANNGEVFELNAEEISFKVSAILDTESVTKYKNDDQTLNYVPFVPDHNGVNIPVVSVKLYIPKTDLTQLNTLYMFVKTKGLKRLYCDLAQVMFDTLQDNPYFEGYVTNLNIRDNPVRGGECFIVSFDFVVAE